MLITRPMSAAVSRPASRGIGNQPRAGLAAAEEAGGGAAAGAEVADGACGSWAAVWATAAMLRPAITQQRKRFRYALRGSAMQNRHHPIANAAIAAIAAK